ncbi:glycosyltransferase family 4 protein [Nostoc sp. XA010]|uniref:glycosyltransferase family 4 protein n=1 Tax=Nostoc sp. XA010 TaxID=2780407 RepID=UPI001E331E47|nr:glycosyltransferase family 4 protein [Nostoc sp. XA010]MCC5661835.1 glycosyltransferase family 4 protein [Nostoc sp. XA010]
MKIKNLVVTGEQIFIERHQFLFKALSAHVENIKLIPRNDEWYESRFPKIAIKGILSLMTGSHSKANAVFQKNKFAFNMKSYQAENEIKNLGYTPDIVFQVFGTYSPFRNNFDIPYVAYLDYTTALAEKNWSSWAYFLTPGHRDSWFECERLFYSKAKHLFCMNNISKQSLIKDYEIDNTKITVVGSSGDFLEPLSVKKTFGSKQILFNGSDFERKGGDLVLSAFEVVRKTIPEATLVFVGKKISHDIEGIINPGHVSSTEIHNFFQNTDLVVAPAYCDPFPTFLIEAMNYGVPCVVSAKDGMPEIVENNINGSVIEQLTPENLANKIIYLLSNPNLLTSMSHLAQRKIEQQFNWEKIAEKMVNVISG